MTSQIAAELRQLMEEVLAGQAQPPAGQLPDCWPTLVELGLPLVGIPVDRGGSGGELADLAVLARELGRHGVSAPLIEAATAAAIMAEHGAAAPAKPGTAPPGGPGFGTVAVLSCAGTGEQPRALVPWGRHAAYVVLFTPEGRCLHAPAAATTLRESRENLAGEPQDLMTFDLAGCSELGCHPAAQADLALLWATAIAGASDATVRLTAGYLATREQFGQPLNRIPAVAAGLARMRAAVIQADAVIERALDARPAAAPHAATVARVITGQAATAVAALAHQLHGAMGITAEYGLGRLTTRLWAWRDMVSSEDESARQVGRAVRDGGESVLWEQLTAWTPTAR